MIRLETLREILASLKRRRPSRKYCPRCGNPHIHLSNYLWILPERYTCEKCGYQGLVALEMENE